MRSVQLPLCRPCTHERDRWVDTTPSTLIPQHALAVACRAAYDDTSAGVRDNTRARYEDWKRTVNYQRDLIARICRHDRHVTWSQPDLLAELTAREAS